MTRTARRTVQKRKRGFADEATPMEAAESPFEGVMDAARRAGLLEAKTARIAGRVSPTLVARAKKRTGIKSDSDLIAFALAQIALEDDFAEAFRRARGKVDPDIDLEF